MSVLAFVVQVAAVVIAAAGVRKLVDPTAIAAALDAARLPSGSSVGRVVGLTEAAIGAWVLAAGGRGAATGLAAVYAGFLGFIAANRLRGLDVPCGCLGASISPPGAVHVAVNSVAVVAATAAVVWPVDPATAWLDRGATTGAVVLAGVVACAALVIVALEARTASR